MILGFASDFASDMSACNSRELPCNSREWPVTPGTCCLIELQFTTMLMTHEISFVPSIHVTTPTHFLKPYVSNVLVCTVRVRFAFIAVAVAELPPVGAPLQYNFNVYLVPLTLRIYHSELFLQPFFSLLAFFMAWLFDFNNCANCLIRCWVCAFAFDSIANCVTVALSVLFCHPARRVAFTTSFIN